MQAEEIEPLDAILWFKQAEKLLAKLDGVESDEQLSEVLRQAYHLLQLTPRPLRQFLRVNLDEATFDDMLEVGAGDAAALALVRVPLGLDLVRRETSLVYEAGIWLPGQEEIVRHTAPSLANAVLGALLGCLCALRERTFAREDGNPLH